MRNPKSTFCRLLLLAIICQFSLNSKAQTETLSSGAFIINMGATNPNTIANGLKPYGLIYDLMRNNSVPIKWVVSQTKLKDGVDFTHNGVQYKGGTFIIPAEYRSTTVNTKITSWVGLGVVGVTTTTPLTVDVSKTLTAVPKWTLDAANGSIAEGYLINAGVTNTAFPGAYNWKLPAALDCCDDFFVMPHADPIWATHGRLWSWNKDCLGTIWNACHATSALENMVNPADRNQQTNFLTRKVAGLAGTSGNYALSNSLILWGSHAGGSIPYIHQFPNDLVAQYMGVTDAAHQNGSEQIDVPNQSATGGWNLGAKIIAYDPTQVNVTDPIRPDKTNAAAVMVYGRGFDDPTRGFVMYEPAHSHNKGSVGDVAAQRAFWNFSFFQVQPKAPQITVSGINTGQQVTNGTLLNLSVSATSPLTGITFSYLWSSTCGGTFSNPTLATTTFNPPTTAGTCVVTCKVTDNCGRASFQSFPVVILPAAAPPTVVPDVATLSGSCSPGTSITLNVLTNDVPNASSITFTSLNQGAASPANAGTWTNGGNGNVTFTPNANFNGAATITYTVTNTQGLTNTTTITVNVGSTDVNGCTSNQVYSPTDVGLVTLATGSFVSQSGTTATIDETSLDDAENIYTDNNVDYVNFGTAVGNNLVMAIGSTFALRAKDTINIYWSKSNNTTATMSVQIGQSATGPWTNAQTFTNAIALSGTAANTLSEFIIPGGVSGITHIRINAGTLPATNSGTNVWVDEVEYEYLSCISRAPQLSNDATTILEDAPAVIDVLANDIDPQGLLLTVKRIVTQPTNGKVSINLDGTITYINTTDIATATSFVYEACNAQGYCSTATVNIIIVDDFCGAGLFKANPPGGAITKVFQSGFVGTNAATANITTTNFRDSKLNQASSGNDNYGADSRFEIGKVFSATTALRDIFQFNIAEIPTTAVIQSATFSAYRPGGNNDVQTVNLHGLSQSFVENQVTWMQRSTGTNWTTAGGSFGAVISSASLNGTRTRYSWDVKSLVDSWVATPANNFGLLLKTGETLNRTHQINSKEIGTIGFRPALSVTYVIPEPCAAITNRAPLAQPDYSATVNGQVVTISPLPNDADVDAGNTFTITGVSGITAGSATFTGTTITYTANINATVPRTERLTYTITDNNGATGQAYVYITVTNAPPTANKDLASTNSGTLVSIPVTGNDNDPEGGSLTPPVITIVPKNGTATLLGNNIQYTPGPGFTGNDTLVYQLCETAAGSCSPIVFCDTALVVITVNNRPPVANNDLRTMLPCITTTFSLILNDTDPEVGVLAINTISALSNPAAGTLTNNGDGTVSFLPAVGFLGNVTFTYTVIDNGVTPLISAPATVTITVASPANTAPDAVNDVETINMDEISYYSVRDNDTDPEGDLLRLPTITIAPLHGTAIVLSNGLVQYTPNPGYYGTDVLTYQLCDSSRIPATCNVAPPLCDVATLTYTILVPNTVYAVNDENSTSINTPVSGGVVSNDFDLEGDVVLFTGFMDVSGNTFTTGTITVSGVDPSGASVANAGTLTINANGTYTFTPANNFIGVVTVPYSITDDNTNPAKDLAYLRITVSPNASITNSIIANNDENISYGATVNGNVTTNDRDPQGNLFSVTGFTYDTDGNPATPNVAGTVGTPVVIGGTTTTGAPVTNAGTLTLNANGSYTFIPAVDFTGSVDVPYTICDQAVVPQACQTALLHIDVLPNINGPANDPPVAGDDFNVTNINTPVGGSFINNDSDPNGNPVSLNGVTINTGGAKTPIGAPVATSKGGTVQYYADGTYLYTPAFGYIGPDSVAYTICDVTAVAPQPLCTKAFLHFVIDVDNSTNAINDETSTWQDVNVSGGVLANDFDKENNTQNFGSFLAQGVSPGAPITSGAVVSGVNKAGGPVANAGTLTFAANGTYTFDPDPSFTGTVAIPYRLCDNGNQSKCDTAFLTITVDPLPTTGINTVIANNDENISYNGATVGGSLFVNDHDPQNDAFTVTSFTGGSVGTPGTVSGKDQYGNTVANAGTLTINANGTYTFVPLPGFVGNINVPYTITDANGATSTAVLHIDVLKDPNGALNDPPFAGDDFGYTTINKTVAGSFNNNDSDPNGNPLSYNGTTIIPAGPATAIGAPVVTAQGGTVQFYANGTYLYTPPLNYVGPDQVPYTTCDVTAVAPQPLCADAVIHLLVGPGINISGKVWNDADGNVIDPGASEPETNIGGTLYVNLVDGSGNVVATTPVAANGTYSFANINPGVNYSIQLTTNLGTVGQPAPAVALPTGWVNTGETRNGTIDGGTAGMIDSRNFGYTNTVNFDFGIERLPETNNATTLIPAPFVGQFTTLNGGANPPVLSGSDPEDQPSSGPLTGKAVRITTVPSNTELYYNGVLITAGTNLSNFNPSLFQVKFIAATVGTNTTSFTFAYIDAAGKVDPTPATYTLNWIGIVPVEFISFNLNKVKNTSVLDFTVGTSAIGSIFIIERSEDGRIFATIGQVNGTSTLTYQFKDLSPIFNAKNYYRIKEIDLNNRKTYSVVRFVQFAKDTKIEIYPVPAVNNITLSFDDASLNKRLRVEIYNNLGQLLIVKTIKTASANEIIDVTSLINGNYHIRIKKDNEVIADKKIIITK